jgi:hypothetical protein
LSTPLDFSFSYFPFSRRLSRRQIYKTKNPRLTGNRGFKKIFGYFV